MNSKRGEEPGMIRLEAIRKQYKGAMVLDGIDLLVRKGDFVIFTGRSGGGKTTLLSVMGGLTRPDEGTASIDGADILHLSDPELAAVRNRKIGFVFQFPSLISSLNVLDNILLPIAFSGRTPNSQDRDSALSLLEMAGISGKEGHYPSQLSGGQQRRAAIARALINRPAIILADEPTGDLDEKSEEEIMHFFHELNRQGVTLVMVTHALDYVRFGKTYTLKGGRLNAYEASEVSPSSAVRGGA